MTCAALGLDEQAVKDYISQQKADLSAIRSLDESKTPNRLIAGCRSRNITRAVRGYNHDDETRKGIHKLVRRLPMIRPRPRDAVNLNNLDDWYEFHQAVLK
jgi:hypothetical protein